ncbi:MAG: c-type cytochrome [Sulfurimonadaceae bacterium]
MRSTLLFTFTLFLAACSDNTTNNQSTTSNSSEKEVVVEQKQAALQTEPVKKAVKPVELKDEPAVIEKEETAISGHAVFARKCASCHGKNGEKSALNKSQIITGWDTQKTVSALKGYQDGSYGGSMKAIMKGQVSALSDAQIEAVSEYISTL